LTEGEALGLDDGLLLDFGASVGRKEPVGVGPLFGDEVGAVVDGEKLGIVDEKNDGVVVGLELAIDGGRDCASTGPWLGLEDGPAELSGKGTLLGDFLGRIVGLMVGLKLG
jgi:hypothetical protein